MWLANQKAFCDHPIKRHSVISQSKRGAQKSNAYNCLRPGIVLKYSAISIDMGITMLEWFCISYTFMIDRPLHNLCFSAFLSRCDVFCYFEMKIIICQLWDKSEIEEYVWFILIIPTVYSASCNCHRTLGWTIQNSCHHTCLTDWWLVEVLKDITCTIF